MSHEITATDRMVLAARPAWHGLGTVLPERCTVDEARRLALPWDPVAVPMMRLPIHCDLPAEHLILVDHRAVVRDDTGDLLGVVGPDYRVLPNSELAAIIEGLGAAGLSVESAGSIRGGREVFFLIDRGSFDAAPGDEIRRYVLFTSAHDGTRAFRALPTNVRVVCKNTLTWALADSAGLTAVHRSGMRKVIDEARDAILGMDKALDRRRDEARAMAVRPIRGDELSKLFVDVYARVSARRARAIAAAADASLRGLDRPSREVRAAANRAHRHREATLARWVESFELQGDRTPSVSGTVWAAVQAITEDLEHGGYSTRVKDSTAARLVGVTADRVRAAHAQAAQLVGGAA